MPHSRVNKSRIEQFLYEMTLEEKISLCHACSKFSVGAIERLRIPEFWMSDGPHGVREEVCRNSWMPANNDDDFVTYLPVGTALAATWSPEMGHLHGKVLGTEARGRRKDVILGPGVNIMRTPLCGRNFEYLGEDPFLASEMVVPQIQGVQECDTAACVKHYAMNNQELDRHGTDVEVDERTLREIYLPAFEAAVKRGEVLTLMGAYNLFRGQHCCHNEYLLNDILKGEWGFEGLVVSDWNGVHDTDQAVRFGMDIEMGTGKPYDQYYLATPFLEGIREGKYPVSLLDAKVKRILTVMMAIGIMDNDRKEGAYDTPEHKEAALTIARESVVLLKNDGVLPLNSAKVKKLAVIGENAALPQAHGGGSSGVKTSLEITPLAALEKMFGDEIEINYIPGYPVRETPHVPIPTEYLAAADETGTGAWTVSLHHNTIDDVEPYFTETLAEIDMDWAAGFQPYSLKLNDDCMSIQATVQLPEDGCHELQITCIDECEVKINGERKFMCQESGPAILNPTIDLEGKAGDTFEIKVRYLPRQVTNGVMRIGWLTPSASRDLSKDPHADAIAAAKDADAVLFFGGLNHRYDAEGGDRADMKLIDGQDDLIAKLASANSNMAVFIISGCPVEMPWINDVKAVVQGWYNGSHSGTAMAEVAFGLVNPSGKLPFTFPVKLEDTPAATVGEYKAGPCIYHEGMYVGYRWYDKRELEVLFPFGHGLSYTSFSYDSLKVTAGKDATAAVIELQLTNTGEKSGSEVVQIYASKPESKVERVVRELKGFKKVSLAAGETKTVQLEISRRALAYYDVDKKDWVTEAGEYVIEAASSSRDIRQKAKLQLS